MGNNIIGYDISAYDALDELRKIVKGNAKAELIIKGIKEYIQYLKKQNAR